MAEPTPIKPGVITKNEPDPYVVALLEKYLQQAKEGHVISVAIALDTETGTVTDWAGSRESVRVLGAVSLLSTRLGMAINAHGN